MLVKKPREQAPLTHTTGEGGSQGAGIVSRDAKQQQVLENLDDLEFESRDAAGRVKFFAFFSSFPRLPGLQDCKYLGNSRVLVEAASPGPAS